MKKNNEPKLRILMYMNENQDKTFTQAELSKKLDLHYSTISVHIKQLQKDGWLMIQTGVYKNKISASRKLVMDDKKDFVWKYI